MAKVRLADIAVRVGVSTVTVHNALSGQKGVSDELRPQIIALARWDIARTRRRQNGREDEA